MPQINAPPVENQLTDLELFAKAYFNIEMTHQQMEMMESIADGKPISHRIMRRHGIANVNRIAAAYIKAGLDPHGRERLPQIHLSPKREIKGVTQHGRVLNAIKHGGAFNFELSRIALKYTSVISDLRKDGHTIIAERQIGRNGKKSNTFKYYLIGD